MNWEEAYADMTGSTAIASPSRRIAYKNVWLSEDDCETFAYGIWQEGDRIRIDVTECYGKCDPGTEEDMAATDWVVAW